MECPLISAIVINNGNAWPGIAKDLLLDIIQLCQAPYSKQQQQPLKSEPTDLEFWEEGHYYPFWPRIRQGLKYSSFHTNIPGTRGGLYLALLEKVLPNLLPF